MEVPDCGNSNAAPVTVVVPCYRCAKTIGRALLSVINQTLCPAEIILVDDGSADDTLLVLRNLEKEYSGRVRILRLQKNEGVAHARNAGWAEATQPYVAFLDADDAWHPKKIEIQYRYLEIHNNAVLCGHKHRILKGQIDQPDWKVGECRVRQISKLSLLLSNPFITPSVMIKRDVPYRFLDGRRHMEDHLLWMQIICAGLPVISHSAELAAIYKPHFGASGLSSEIHDMESADLENYRMLYQQASINLMQLISLTVYSLLKYFRRLGILQWRRLKHFIVQQKAGG